MTAIIVLAILAIFAVIAGITVITCTRIMTRKDLAIEDMEHERSMAVQRRETDAQNHEQWKEMRVLEDPATAENMRLQIAAARAREAVLNAE